MGGSQCCSASADLKAVDTTKLLPIPEVQYEFPQDREAPFTLNIVGQFVDGVHQAEVPRTLMRAGVLKVACGSAHFLILTESGQVLAAGDNLYGQCTTSEPVASLMEVAIRSMSFLDIAAGSRHSIILGRTSKQKFITNVVLTFGYELALGFSDRMNKTQPTELDLGNSEEDQPAQVFANFNHSAAVTSKGKLYTWGEALFPPVRSGIMKVELPLETDDAIIKVDFCRKSASSVTKFGHVFTWGDNTYGELGLPKVRKAETPIKVPNLSGIIDIAAGARHVIALDFEGVIYAFGDNSEGQCANEDTVKRGFTTVIAKSLMGTENLQAKYVFASESQSALVSTSGEFLVWGDNSQGKLGSVQTSITRPTLVESFINKKLSAVGLGQQFAVVVTGPTGAALQLKKKNQIKPVKSVEAHRRSFPSNVRLGEKL
mmetsp:Transcript_6937/g.12618  ORF Transcript_6937/g.12618 Transcript_6937/m.12618 type:complete len:430 (+) Transcript_6937:3155-4444(+)